MEGLRVSDYEWDWDTHDVRVCEGNCIEIRRPVKIIEGKALCKGCCEEMGISVVEQGELF